MRRLSVSFGILVSVLIIFVAPAAFASNYGAGNYGDCDYGTACYISISTPGTLSISLTPTPSGAYSVLNDAATVITDNAAGYTLSLSSSSATVSALVNGGNTIPASSGTFSSPTTLSVNTWGYRVDGQGGFGAGPTSALSSVSSTSLTFAGIPLSGSPDTIVSTSSAAHSPGTTTNIWYGLGANLAKPSGPYSQTVTYTAVIVP